ncbi:MAG TPA: CYTH domain-containing protein, partial [Candidatus Limnocylindrales bacterium]|nr:CYTH domain-containing protein [Candidatus Limnocylindrales bacterium]
MSDLRRAVETELKFQVATPGAADRLLAADQLGGLVAEAPPRTEQQDDRYLDTADAALARAGFALRIRQHGGQTIVGVKSLRRRGGRAGLHRREELEGPAELGALPRDWPPSPARSLVLELAGDAPLVEVVTIRQLRRKRELRRDDAVVELSLDEVDVIVHGRVVERFEELEAELVTGPEEALDGLLDAFEDTPGLGPVDGSKLERALAAARREGDVSGVLERVIRAAAHDLDVPESAPVKPVPPVADAPAARPGDLPKPGKSPGVAGDDHLSEAGRKVLRHHLALMLAREAGTRSGADPEDLHKMR